MVGAGMLMILLGLLGTWFMLRNKIENKKLLLRLLIPAISLPFIANSAGWIMTEVGRQPWIVFGLQHTADGVSPNVSTGMVATSLIGFTVIYGILAVVFVYLVVHFVRKGIETEPNDLHSKPQEHGDHIPAI